VKPYWRFALEQANSQTVNHNFYIYAFGFFSLEIFGVVQRKVSLGRIVVTDLSDDLVFFLFPEPKRFSGYRNQCQEQ